MAGSVLGIDYSFTSPALCFHDGTSPPRWWVHYKPKTKTPYPVLPNVTWSVSTATSDVQRYLELANWVLQVVYNVNPHHIVLEDYAFAANGRVSMLAENGGVLKAKLYERFPLYPVHVVAPTSMKKFATGNGRAQKEDIWASFIQRFADTATWPSTVFPKAKTAKINSPLSDIADAFFLADYGRTL